MIGTYTTPGKSEGIYVYEFDSQSGEMKYKSKTIIVSEGASSKISSFAFNSKTGDLNFLNNQSSGSSGPTYISVYSKGKYVFAANYGGGSITDLPVNADGTLGADIQDIKHEGSSIVRKKPFVHSAVVSPDNKFVLTADLGTDKFNSYRLNAKSRTQALTAAKQPFVTLDPGAGPRYLNFTLIKNFSIQLQKLTPGYMPSVIKRVIYRRSSQFLCYPKVLQVLVMVQTYMFLQIANFFMQATEAL